MRSFTALSPFVRVFGACVFTALLALAGCDSDDGGDGGTTKTATTPWIADGDYFVGIELVEFSGVKLKMTATVSGGGEKSKASKIAKIELRGLPLLPNGTIDQTTAMGTVEAVDIDADGKFVANFGEITVPGPAIPTGTDTKVTLILDGQVNADGTFCGLVKGEVPVFKQKLEVSTFNGVVKGSEPAEGFITKCGGGAAKLYTHIDACPQVLDGPNKMTSAEAERSFDVYLPKGVTGTADLPVVFLFHGVGGSSAKFIDETKFDALLTDNSFVLVVPQSTRKADGTPTQKLDWFFSSDTYDMDNQDLVFFDDMLKCVGETWKIDSKRVYVTGMSGGGLMSTFIAANRGSVVAAAAPFSGGYAHPKWPDDKTKTPFMVSWGGVKDEAFGQDFHKLANGLIAFLTDAKQPYISCDHGQEHEWVSTASKDAWTFLSQFTLGGNEKPDISALPSYCK